MAVTGRVKASRLRRNVGARPGDALVLTKALGTGILTSAMRARVLREGSLRALLGRGEGPDAGGRGGAPSPRWSRLNRAAARAADAFDVSASTDVTGYGLLGHLKEMLGGGGVSAEISVSAAPAPPGRAAARRRRLRAGRRRGRTSPRRGPSWTWRRASSEDRSSPCGRRPDVGRAAPRRPRGGGGGPRRGSPRRRGRRRRRSWGGFPRGTHGT